MELIDIFFAYLLFDICLGSSQISKSNYSFEGISLSYELRKLCFLVFMREIKRSRYIELYKLAHKHIEGIKDL